MYLNLEGAATFILASVKYLRDKSLVSNCYSFNMYQWRLAAIKWKKEAMCPTEVWGLRNNAPIALESKYVELLFFQDSCGSLSPLPPFFVLCGDHSCCLWSQDGSSNTALYLINLRREGPPGNEKTWKSVNIVMLSWHVKCWITSSSCHCEFIATG